MAGMNWDDLPIVAAVADQGSYARAAAKLQLDETTVGRRVARMQKRLGMTLFEAVDGVRRPTAACRAILAHIREMSRHVAEIANVGNVATGVVGTIRLASTPSVLDEILAPAVAEFLDANPGLTLRLMGADTNVNFSRWETDIAVRLRKPAKGDFSISRLGCCRVYLFQPAAPHPPGREPVVCRYPKEIDFSPESKYLATSGLYGTARCVTESLPIMRSLIERHAAIGVLPDFVSRTMLDDPALRVTLLEERKEFWLLVQNHLKRDPATRVVIDWLRGLFAPVRR